MDTTNIYKILKPLKKHEILKLAALKCKHGKSLIEHPACIPNELKANAKVGILDIENSGLNANYGIMLSYCIKELNGPLYGDYIHKSDFKTKPFDNRLVQHCIEDMRRFDRLIVYWGKNYRHDIPFIRSRAIKAGLEFPRYQELIVEDLYDIVKSKLRLNRNSLAVACGFFGITAKTHPLKDEIWEEALFRQDEKALKYVYEHNKEDVISTEKLYKLLVHYDAQRNTSI